MTTRSQPVDFETHASINGVQSLANETRTQSPISAVLCKLPEGLRGLISVQANGCWLWTGKQFTNGYGAQQHHGKLWKAHRLIWTLLNGPIPPGIHCLHHCDTPLCVNVLDTEHHIFLGTNRDNQQDKAAKGRHWQQKKTHCPRGHEYTPENTYIPPSGGRHCRICRGMQPVKVVA